MGDIHDDLREVMGLLGKAAPGEWAVDQDRQVYTLEAYVCNANIRHTEYDNEATAQAIAAAVNFLRQHGPALLAAAKYEEANPLGGPATMLEAAARRIRVGEDFHEVLADYGLLARQEGEDDTARLDWLCTGNRKRVEDTIETGWFRVYEDVASAEAEHAEWRAMTEQFYPTVREAIDAARSGGGG